jgi:hypothetical protein
MFGNEAAAEKSVGPKGKPGFLTSKDDYIFKKHPSEL